MSTHDMPMQTQMVGEGIVPTHLHPRCYKGVGGQHHNPAALPPRERPGAHCAGGRMALRVGLYGHGKSRLCQDLVL
jgi:hypothetical protein